MKPEERALLENTAKDLRDLKKIMMGFLDIYYRSHLIDKWVLTNPLVLRNTDIIIEGDKGMKIGSTLTKLGFFGKTPATKPTALTTKLTDITFTAPSTPDYAIQDLTQTTPYGFATKDEGNTVLSVIKNLQTRVAELETKLQAVGLLT